MPSLKLQCTQLISSFRVPPNLFLLWIPQHPNLALSPWVSSGAAAGTLADLLRHRGPSQPECGAIGHQVLRGEAGGLAPFHLTIYI